MTPEVSVLIVSRSNADGLRAALASIREHAPADVPFEVVVLLNAATPETAAAAASDPAARVVVSPVNLGVAGGYNAAREAAQGRYLLLTHDDVLVRPGWIEELVAVLGTTPSAGIAGSRVLEMGGDEVQLSGAFVHSDLWITQVTERLAPDHIASTDPRRVDVVPSSSMLVRASVWDAIGGCDEGLFPSMFVDVDLCLATRRIGCDVLVVPASQLHHARGTSTATAFREWIVARNTASMLGKWRQELDRFHEPGGRAMQWLALRAADRPLLPRPLPPRLPVPPGDREARHRVLQEELDAAWALQDAAAA